MSFRAKHYRTVIFVTSLIEPDGSDCSMMLSGGCALDANIVWLYVGLVVSVPRQPIVVRRSLTILEKSHAKAASLFVHPPTAVGRNRGNISLSMRPRNAGVILG